MNRQVHPKTNHKKKTSPARKRVAVKAKPRAAPAPKRATAERSTLHWHTPAELQRIEEEAQRHIGEEHRAQNATGFAVALDDGGFEVRDDLAEQLAEEFLLSALRGEETHRILDDENDEEALGPVIETSADNVFANTEDEMNSDATLREPLPTAGQWNLSRSERHKRLS